ncbi:hypothetical protein C8Q76DRAFT_834033 [Earliella scabrosa]|nr:hypothetical protein C8Q76DRAFT_834033 [Earliella scabrosa]
MSSTSTPPPALPLPRSAKAPSFDPLYPQTINRFFDDLEFIFERSQVPDVDRKRFTGRYVPYEVEELWTSLPEWSPKSSVTFSEFRAAVVSLYPEVRAERKFVYRDLLRLVESSQDQDIETLQEYGEFYRAFYRISSYLRQKDELGLAEQGRLFARSFPINSRFRRQLSRRLRLKFPDRHLTDTFSLAELHDAAVFVLQAFAAGVFLPRDESSVMCPTPLQPSGEPDVPVAREPPVNPRATALPTQPNVLATSLPADPARVESTESAADNVPKMVPFVSANTLVVDECHYCGAPKCYIRSCPAVAADITAGRCARNADGQVILPSGRFVPRSLPGRTMRERVLEWRRRNPQEAASHRELERRRASSDRRASIEPERRAPRELSPVSQAHWHFDEQPRPAEHAHESEPWPYHQVSPPTDAPVQVDQPLLSNQLVVNPVPEWRLRKPSEQVAVTRSSPPSPPGSPRKPLVAPCDVRTPADSDSQYSQDRGAPPIASEEVVERIAQRILKIPVQLSPEQLAALFPEQAASGTSHHPPVHPTSPEVALVHSVVEASPRANRSSATQPFEWYLLERLD